MTVVAHVRHTWIVCYTQKGCCVHIMLALLSTMFLCSRASWQSSRFVHCACLHVYSINARLLLPLHTHRQCNRLFSRTYVYTHCLQQACASPHCVCQHICMVLHSHVMLLSKTAVLYRALSLLLTGHSVEEAFQPETADLLCVQSIDEGVGQTHRHWLHIRVITGSLFRWQTWLRLYTGRQQMHA